MSVPMTEYQSYTHLAKYARWQDDLGRRESWQETVGRYVQFFLDREVIDYETAELIYGAIVSHRTLPSMRALQSAGPALERDNLAAYNCAYTTIDDPRAFDEALYILMCTVGVGFTVERQDINRLPEVPEKLYPCDTVIVVRDSKMGWAKALRQLIAMLYAGEVPTWDTTRVRRKGSRLKTFGGQASGPEPLEELFRFVINLFQNACGRRLTSIECHDLMCKIGEIVVVGGVRRAALISLSNLSDQRMRDAKSGQWWETAPWRRLANNSIAFTERPDVGQFMEEWNAIYHSKSGERGIFNRVAARKKVESIGRRKIAYDDAGEHMIPFGINPCSEIILRPHELCNLSNIIARRDDTVEDLVGKAVVATILGTIQSTLTDFRYTRAAWRRNCEEERLIGVGIAGIMDCPLLNGRGTSTKEVAELLEYLKNDVVRQTNVEWAERLGINESTANTCVKPDGNSSQLVDASSGMHARHGRFYIRRTREDAKNPLTQFMLANGFVGEPDVTDPNNTIVFSWPIRAPKEAVLRDEVSAIEQLEHWKVFQDHWCEHKPSITVNVREHEWPEVGAWVWKHFDEMSGVSFLPESDHVYQQAPYETVDEDRLKELEAAMPKDVDWDGLSAYEETDNTTSGQEAACTGGACEI